LQDDQNNNPANDNSNQHSQSAPNEPMFNLPAPLKWISLILIAMHLIIHYGPPNISELLLIKLVYIPARFSLPDLLWYDPVASLISPFGYTFVHSNWLHLVSNLGMFLAFGVALFRLIGTQRLLLIWVIGAISGVIILSLIDPTSRSPVMGASASVSAVLGALLYFSWMLAKLGIAASVPFASKDRIITFLLIWTGMTLLPAFIPFGPEGTRIAWEAHLAGFASGAFAAFCLVKLRWLRF